MPTLTARSPGGGVSGVALSSPVKVTFSEDVTGVSASSFTLKRSGAAVLATVKRDGMESRGEQWATEDEDAFRTPIRDQFEAQGSPYYSSARLWDDGIIAPIDTRRVLAMGLQAASAVPIPEPRFGLFRM